jgi:hypothetical protein
MRMHRWLCAAAAAVVLATPAGLRAQQSPEQVVRAYYTHLRQGDAAELARLTHPVALERFKTTIVDMMRGGGGGDTDFPLAPEELAALPADSAYIVFMTGVGEGMNSAEMRSLMEDLQIEVLGNVAQGDSAVHVVYDASATFMETTTRQTMVVTLRRDGREWRVDPGEGLMNMMGAGVMNLLMSSALQAGMASAFSGGEP